MADASQTVGISRGARPLPPAKPPLTAATLLNTLQRRPELVTVPLVFIVFMAGWQGAIRIFGIDPLILPGPIEILRELRIGLASGIYVQHGIVTAEEMFGGFLIGSCLGLLIGAVVAQFPLIRKTFFAYLVGIQTIPKLAIAPLLIVWFGFGVQSKLFITAMIVFFPMVVNVIEGFQSTDQRQLDMLRAAGADRWQQFKMVLLPNALPSIFVGANVGVVLSILGAVVGEFLGAQKGLGYLILQYNYSLKIAAVFGVLAILATMGITLHLAVTFLQRYVVFWRRPARHTEGQG